MVQYIDETRRGRMIVFRCDANVRVGFQKDCLDIFKFFGDGARRITKFWLFQQWKIARIDNCHDVSPLFELLCDETGDSRAVDHGGPLGASATGNHGDIQRRSAQIPRNYYTVVDGRQQNRFAKCISLQQVHGVHPIFVRRVE